MCGPTEPPTSKTPTSRRKIIILVTALTVAIAITITIKKTRHHIFPKRFGTVEAGKLYRSGYLHEWPLNRVCDKYDLKTVLCLLHNVPWDNEFEDEKAILDHNGVAMINIGMPGDGIADFNLLDKAAAIVNDPENYPMLVHCSAGVMRTSATYVCWRTRYSGWDLDKALAEVKPYGVSQKETPELVEHLRNYYQQRVLPARIAKKPSQSR